MKRNIVRIALALIMMLGILVGTTTTMTKPVEAACSHPIIIKYLHQDSTCTKMKIYYRECIFCHALVGAEIYPKDPNKHTWQRVTTISPASCTRSGVDFYRCAECGKTREQTVPATGHKMSSKYVNGKYVRYCTICGYEAPEILYV